MHAQNVLTYSNNCTGQVDWSHQLAAFKILLDEGLQQSKEKPERGMLARATALVTTEVQAGVTLHLKETNTLQDSYLGILQNALNQLQASPYH